MPSQEDKRQIQTGLLELVAAGVVIAMPDPSDEDLGLAFIHIIHATPEHLAQALSVDVVAAMMADN